MVEINNVTQNKRRGNVVKKQDVKKLSRVDPSVNNGKKEIEFDQKNQGQ